ncbi:MAG: signal peptidase I [Thiothrix sp.]|nr:signal peptidase I [Thiothrix sp.]HPQ94458.1 signal peptidase I [Thiolinea sp.]
MSAQKTATDTIRPRLPWLAALLSLVFPGLGQLYNGEPNRAAWVFMGCVLPVLPGFALVLEVFPAPDNLQVYLLFLLLAAAVWLYGLIDAWRDAGRKPDFMPRHWQGAGTYLLTVLLLGEGVLPAWSAHIRQHQFELMRIPSASMEPQLVAGDIIVVDKSYNCPGCGEKVGYGDIVIFAYPNDPGMNYIKRVIGLPGDRVRMRAGRLYLNGNALTRQQNRQDAGGLQTVLEQQGEKSWVAIWKPDGNRPLDFDLTVPSGQAFVMGDNRAFSSDSRVFGPISLNTIRGRAMEIVLSYNRSLGGLQLQRSGQVLP